MARPKLKSRGDEMQIEQFHEHATLTPLDALETKSNGLKSQCQFKSSHEMLNLSIMPSYKVIIQSTKFMLISTYCKWAATALPYQHWISSRDLSMKKLGILRTEMVFPLSCCLLLRVMCPLHLQELDGLVASLALGILKNTDWTL